MGTPSPDWRWPFLAVLLGLTIQKKHELRFAPGRTASSRRGPPHLLRAVVLVVSLRTSASRRLRPNSASCLSAPTSTSCLGGLFVFESPGSQQAQFNQQLLSSKVQH